MANVIVLLIILIMVAASITFIIRSKKKGQKCIGCSNSASCPKCAKKSELNEK